MENGKIGIFSAIFTVLASMIGTGIFGITGILQAELMNPSIIIACWLVGGFIALAGALCYSEIASNYPLIGGEFVYLKHFYGDLPAFLTGWTSIFVAFSAPVAATAYLFTEYTYNTLLAFEFHQLAYFTKNFHIECSTLIIMILSCMHILGVRKGIIFQNLITVLKVISILFLIGFGIHFAYVDHFMTLSENFSSSSTRIPLGKLGSAFMMISFSFSGWNAAIYLGSEIKDASKNIPKALFWGTVLTMLIYVTLQLMIYACLSTDKIIGETALLSIVSSKILSQYSHLDKILNIILCLVLLSSMSVNILLGSRICFAVGSSMRSFKIFSSKNNKLQTPINAIIFQSLIAIIYLITGTFSSIVIYMGFSLSIFPMLTVGGMWILRKRIPNKRMTYKSPLFPVLPILFISSSVIITTFNLVQNTTEALTSIGLLIIGTLIYYLIEKSAYSKPSHSTHPINY